MDGKSSDLFYSDPGFFSKQPRAFNAGGTLSSQLSLDDSGTWSSSVTCASSEALFSPKRASLLAAAAATAATGARERDSAPPAAAAGTGAGMQRCSCAAGEQQPLSVSVYSGVQTLTPTSSTPTPPHSPTQLTPTSPAAVTADASQLPLMSSAPYKSPEPSSSSPAPTNSASSNSALPSSSVHSPSLLLPQPQNTQLSALCAPVASAVAPLQPPLNSTHVPAEFQNNRDSILAPNQLKIALQPQGPPENNALVSPHPVGAQLITAPSNKSASVGVMSPPPQNNNHHTLNSNMQIPAKCSELILPQTANQNIKQMPMPTRDSFDGNGNYSPNSVSNMPIVVSRAQPNSAPTPFSTSGYVIAELPVPVNGDGFRQMAGAPGHELSSKPPAASVSNSQGIVAAAPSHAPANSHAASGHPTHVRGASLEGPVSIRSGAQCAPVAVGEYEELAPSLRKQYSLVQARAPQAAAGQRQSGGTNRQSLQQTPATPPNVARLTAQVKAAVSNNASAPPAGPQYAPKPQPQMKPQPQVQAVAPMSAELAQMDSILLAMQANVGGLNVSAASNSQKQQLPAAAMQYAAGVPAASAPTRAAVATISSVNAGAVAVGAGARKVSFADELPR